MLVLYTSFGWLAVPDVVTVAIDSVTSALGWSAVVYCHWQSSVLSQWLAVTVAVLSASFAHLLPNLCSAATTWKSLGSGAVRPSPVLAHRRRV